MTMFFTGQFVADQSRQAHVPKELERWQGIHGQRVVPLFGLGRQRIFAARRTR